MFLSEEVIETFFAGRPDPDWTRHEVLVTLDREVATATGGDPPPIGPALARLLGAASAVTTSAPMAPQAHVNGNPSMLRGRPPVAQRRSPRRQRRALAIVAGGLAAAASALPVAAATGVLPEPAHQAVVRVVEAVTPLEFSDGHGDVSPGPTVPAPVSPLLPPVSTGGDAGAAEEPSGTPAPGAGAASAGREAPTSGGTPAAAPGTPPAPGSPGLGVVGQTPAPGVVPPSAGPPADAGPPEGTAGTPPRPPVADRSPATPAPDPVPPAVPASPPGRRAGR